MMCGGRRAVLVLALLVVGTACASGPGGGTGSFPVFLRGDDLPCHYRVTLDLTRGYVLRAPGRPFRRTVARAIPAW